MLIEYRKTILNCDSYVFCFVLENLLHSLIYQRQVLIGIYKCLSTFINYRPTFCRLKSATELYWPDLAKFAELKKMSLN